MLHFIWNLGRLTPLITSYKLSNKKQTGNLSLLDRTPAPNIKPFEVFPAAQLNGITNLENCREDLQISKDQSHKFEKYLELVSIQPITKDELKEVVLKEQFLAECRITKEISFDDEISEELCFLKHYLNTTVIPENNNRKEKVRERFDIEQNKRGLLKK
jgi:hypothetical protein